jgi:hypothetical protein
MYGRDDEVVLEAWKKAKSLKGNFGNERGGR